MAEDNTDYITVTTKDGHEFVLDKQFAINASGTFNAMFGSTDGHFAETSNEIHLRDISASTFEVVVKYFYYKQKYSNATGVIPEFEIDPSQALDVLLAANFLDC